MKNTQEKIMLSQHFSLWEMTRSGTAIELGIDNTPGKMEIESLK